MPSEIFSESDRLYMKRCLQLAANGIGSCSPNPMVGAVIVRDEKIIGEGWHRKAGSPHAEPNAINSVKNQEWLKESTLYVSLEPCSHYGKTPPCADLIIQKQIPRVVIGSLDPFQLVSGRGVAKLLEAGVDVKVGLEKSACLELNKRFFTFCSKKRPFIILKWAQTSDGFMDSKRKPGINQAPLTISSPLTKMLVHKLRSECDAILVGTKTALMDNPRLNVRDWHGNSPVRAVIDRQLVLPEDLHIFDKSGQTIVFTEKTKKNSETVCYVHIDFNTNPIEQILKELYKRNLHTLLVEGGPTLLNSFLKAGAWDEIHIETSPVMIGDGVQTPDFNGISCTMIGEEFYGENQSFRRVQTFRHPFALDFIEKISD